MPDANASQHLFRRARLEAWFVAIVWALALLWTVGYSYLFGYEHAEEAWVVQSGLVARRSAAEVAIIAGFPDWVFFGIIAPWLVCTVITIGFCLWGMSDDELGAEAEEESHA